MTIQAILKPKPYLAEVFDENAPYKTAAFLGCQKVVQISNYMDGVREWIFYRDEDVVLKFSHIAGRPMPMIVFGPDGSVERMSVEDWATRFEVVEPPKETHTEETLYKVRNVLSAQGFAPDQVDSAINDLLNEGILFRERA